MSVAKAYLKCVIGDFQSMKQLGEKTIEQLTIDELNWSPSSESNSISIIVKHLRGNMFSRWTDFLTTDGEKPNRHRDHEFIGNFKQKEELLDAWEEGWNILFNALSQLKENNLLDEVTIRGEKHTVIQAIQRQITHYSSHIGQMVYIGKQIKDKEWNCLSVPRGKSEEFLKEKLRQTK
ncbi:DUF1572 family protein [Fictibacillus sp. Mic-4]|uniref:DUF1572 family protein n=1 Tax=Fictibacillus TaxID=1329200 RepID=UPI000415373D|nr:DUF1572 family protein [Fictibacillus gelatini]